MYVLAVTGGIGSGKSTAARTLGEWGAIVLDLDDVAKRLISANGPLAEPVIAAFGEDIRGEDGGVDTARLAEVAFASRDCARRLNAIVHPGVLAAASGALDMLAAQPEPPEVVVIDIPLLTESPEFFDLIDAVLVVSADEDVRVSRLVARGMPEEDVRARMACQADDSERRAIADWVVDNDGTPEQFRETLAHWWHGEVLARVP